MIFKKSTKAESKPNKSVEQHRKTTATSQSNGGKPSKTNNAGLVSSVDARNRFYKDGRRLAFWLFTISTINTIIATTMLFWSYGQSNQNIYFAIKNDGELVNMIPFSEPNLSTSVVAQWLQKALIDTFDFNFHNIQSHLAESTLKYFTRNGGTAFLASLNDEGNFQTISERKLIVQYIPSGTPIIIKQYLNQSSHLYNWIFQSEGKLSYINQNGQQFSVDVVFKLLVERISLRESPNGIGIAKIIMTKQGS